MSAKSAVRLRLPPGLSPEDEAQWWDDHMDDIDWTEGEFEVVEGQPVERTAPVALRLPVHMIEALKRAAAGTGFSYQWLIRTWLEERLEAETEARDAGAASPPDHPDGARAAG
jgi:predicted DNA binding CopG/RHH family protein